MADPADSRVDMTTGAITPKLATLAWPLVVGNLLQTAYNLADMFWVGRVDAESVAAVSLMFPTAWLFVSVAMGITAAAVAVVSQHVGAGDDRAAEHAVGQVVILTLAVAAGLALVGFALRRPLVWLIGARDEVFTLSIAYIEVIFAAIPFTFLFFAFRAVLRAAGDTKTAMWLVAVSAGINIVIDPFLILGWWAFPAMGVRGAAIATFIARAFAAAAGLYILLDGSWGIRLRVADLRPDPAVLRRLVDIGYPGTADGLLRSLAAVAMAALVARFGPIVTAAYGIGLRLMSVSWTVSGAVGQAAATGVGQNLGARTPDRAETVAWRATAGAMAALFGFGALAFAFPADLMRVFIDDVAVVDEGVRFLRVIAPAWGFFGGLMVIQGAFRGAGFTKHAMVLSLLSRWVLRIPVMAALAFPLGLGALGLWWGWTITTVIAFVIGVVWFNQGGWRAGVLEQEEGSSPGPPPEEAVAEPGGDSEPTD
ncbi:MAG: MATE family efflux transporter [Halobacteriales archaeon]|nr:MATE family efflux transporter [Halobacteriales archaeon]